MLDQKNKKVVPFITAYEQIGPTSPTGPVPKTKKPGSHLNKEQATREVLNRIVNKVKRI
jgi:hypothetical protein